MAETTTIAASTATEQAGPPAPPPVAPEPAPAAAALPEANRRIFFRFVLSALALIGVMLVLYAWHLPPFTSGVQTTENAYVRGQITVMSPQVSGMVTSVAVQDFQNVQQGQLLVTIDDRIYRQRLEQARASLHSAEAALANSAQAQSSARGTVAQGRAGILGAEAELARALADAQRIESLATQGWVTRAQVDTARAALRAAEARLAEARAQEGIAETSVTSAVVGRGSLEAAVENAQAQVRLAEIDLANTRILAPRAGRLGEVTVREGQQVAVGTQLMALVPDRVWVVANMKETQMKNVRVGLPVELSVDALGGETLRGHVERISPATGSEFSVIRPDNATGNFTKVAQRLAVRIAVDPGQPLADQLSPGLSVVARIDTAPSASAGP
jgi:multidrug resistance efflux pump